jgi:biopolymer transport protein ExbD
MRTSARSRSRHRDLTEPAELEVTPFMNLMIVLVPVLLLSLVFTHTAVIELNFPASDTTGEMDPDSVQLEIRIATDALVVADGRSIIRAIPVLADGTHDYIRLSETLTEVKRRLPAKRDATILLAAATDYQTLVFVMDRTRAHRPGLSTQALELFPDISLGDLPVNLAAASTGGKS